MMFVRVNKAMIDALMEKSRKGTHLVPEKRMVTRAGKTFQMTVWVDPRDKSAPAQGGFDFDEKPTAHKDLNNNIGKTKEPVAGSKDDADMTAKEYVDSINKESRGGYVDSPGTLLDGHYQQIQQRIRDGGFITKEVYDSLEPGKQKHLVNKFGYKAAVHDPEKNNTNPAAESSSEPKEITALDIVKDIKVTKVRKNALDFTYKGKDYVFTKYGVLARATKQDDGKTRYSYGSFGDDVKSSVANEVRELFVTSSKYDEKASKGFPEYVFTYKGDISKKTSNESLEQKMAENTKNKKPMYEGISDEDRKAYMKEKYGISKSIGPVGVFVQGWLRGKR